MAKSTFFLCFCMVLSAASSTGARGLRPHASRADYAVTCFTEDIGVGATLVKPEMVLRLFGEEINRNYLVVEVGFYSKNRSVFEVRHADFRLRNRPSRKLVNVANPEAIASTLVNPVNALIDKTLPEVPTSQAVAGYLFFPITEASAAFYELDYTGYGAWLTLPLRPE
jgi:hypothetical protein